MTKTNGSARAKRAVGPAKNVRIKNAVRRIDYRRAPLAFRERTRCVMEGAALAAAVNGLFYRRWLVFIPLSPLAVWWIVRRTEQFRQARRRALLCDFRETLDSLAVAVRAGWSVENALREAEKNVRDIRGDCDMVRELASMNHRISLNEPVTELFLDFAERSGLEDVMNFASVLTAGKNLGGSMADIVTRAARVISDKIDVEREIETAVSAKKFEVTLLSVMPAVIIVYMNLTSPDFLDVLYEGAFGMIVMTACLVLYVAAVIWSRKLIQIEV